MKIEIRGKKHDGITSIRAVDQAENTPGPDEKYYTQVVDLQPGKWHDFTINENGQMIIEPFDNSPVQ